MFFDASIKLLALSMPSIRSTTFLFFVSALTVLAVAHILSLRFFLYWTYLWLDIPMHILGGIVVSLGFLWCTNIHRTGSQANNLLLTLLVLLAVGTMWEVFEYTTGITKGQPNLVSDTVGDFVMNMVGGTLGFLLAFRLSELDRLAASKSDEGPVRDSGHDNAIT